MVSLPGLSVPLPKPAREPRAPPGCFGYNGGHIITLNLKMEKYT